MESCRNQKKVLNKSKYILYLRFFKVATLCLDDSFAHSWAHSMMLLPPCFTVGMVHDTSNFSNNCLQTDYFTYNSLYHNSVEEHHPNCEAMGWQHHVVGVLCCRRDWCTSQKRWHHEGGKSCGYIEVTSQDISQEVKLGHK